MQILRDIRYDGLSHTITRKRGFINTETERKPLRLPRAITRSTSTLYACPHNVLDLPPFTQHLDHRHPPVSPRSQLPGRIPQSTPSVPLSSISPVAPGVPLQHLINSSCRKVPTAAIDGCYQVILVHVGCPKIFHEMKAFRAEIEELQVSARGIRWRSGGLR